MSFLKIMILKVLNSLGWDIKRIVSYPKDFSDLMAVVKDRTLVTVDRCFMIYQYARWAQAQEGAMAEVGVYKGGTAKIIASAAPRKKFYLFDTFDGMPEVNKQVDVHRKGDFNDTSLNSVKSFLKDHDGIHYCPGFFPDTAVGINNERFCFVHIDVDIYSSVKDSLRFFYDRMVGGG